MQKTTVYGLPLNPTHLLNQLKGASFCVSYATRDKLGKQLDQAISLVGRDGILLVDNGAYSHFNSGGQMTPEYIEGFEEWAQEILDRCPQAVAVIPDVIRGTMAQNVEMIENTMLDLDRCMPIWHMDEPISYLIGLCERFGYIGFGSTIDAPGSEKWHARIKEAFAAIDAWELATGEPRPRIHMMRAQAFAHLYPFDSSNSTNVAVNHNRQLKKAGQNVAQFAARVDAKIQASAGPEARHRSCGRCSITSRPPTSRRSGSSSRLAIRPTRSSMTPIAGSPSITRSPPDLCKWRLTPSRLSWEGVALGIAPRPQSGDEKCPSISTKSPTPSTRSSTHRLRRLWSRPTATLRRAISRPAPSAAAPAGSLAIPAAAFGPCFACKGAGQKEFARPAADRAKARTQRVARETNRQVENLEAFKVAQPGIYAWIQSSGDFPFAVSMLQAVGKYGALTDKQLAACQRCVTVAKRLRRPVQPPNRQRR